MVPFRMTLDDGLVARHFGPHPERGRRLMGHNIKATAGLKALPFGRGMARAEVMVQPLMVLKCRGRRQWDVYVEALYTSAAREWLQQYCAPREKQIKKRKRHGKVRGVAPHMIKVDYGW